MRTELGSAALNTSVNKWAATFVVHNGVPGDEYVSSIIETAAIFESETDALAGGERAMVCLAATGRFPNMCEAF